MELNEKWKEKSEEVYAGTYDLYGIDINPAFRQGFIVGAETYADAVEKMLKEKKDNYINAMQENITQEHKDQIAFAYCEIELIIKELKSIQP